MKDKEVLLFINTASFYPSVGVLCEGRFERVDIKEARKVLEETNLAIEECLSRFSLKLKDVTAVYSLLGPGSNTGLRLGLTIPKTMKAFDKDLMLFGIPTLSLTEKAEPSFIPLLSDRNHNFYLIKDSLLTHMKKEEVFSLDASFIVEKQDEETIRILEGKNLKEIDILSLMVGYKDEFEDYSSKDGEYLPLYVQTI